MSRFWTLVRPWAMVVVVGGISSSLPACAEDAKEKPAATADAEKEKDTDEEKDLYAIPEDATVEELVGILEKLKSFRPTTREEYIQHLSKAPDAMKAAAEGIQKLEKDKKSEAYRLASSVLLLNDARTLKTATPAEKADFYKRAKEHIAGGELAADDLRLAMNVAMAFEYGDARDLAGKAYSELGEILSKSEDSDVAEQAQTLIGAGRRMNLVGRPLELKGTTLDGKAFNISNLKGKVVLVDFWATWCGPCLAEYPNIKQNFDDYHDKGFEVVGVSLDKDRDALETYVEDKEVPWTTLHEKEAGGRHPAATYYGILGIPSVILVNKEGNVISLNARGKELGRLLEQELGPVEKTSEDSEKDDAEKKVSKEATE